MGRALIVYGGWQGHDPEGVSAWMAEILINEGFVVDRTADVEALADSKSLSHVELVVPVVTMGSPPSHGFGQLLQAVERGVGIAGCHGGMCDAFRESTDWQFLTGGQFVAHPGDKVEYMVQIKDPAHEITRGVPDFTVTTEQYYMHIDPAVHVLASTTPTFPGPHLTQTPQEMPVAWTRTWGLGRLFYLALGHSLGDLRGPQPSVLMKRGLLWAAGKQSRR